MKEGIKFGVGCVIGSVIGAFFLGVMKGATEEILKGEKEEKEES